jgi:O-antigen ligase
MSFFIDSLIKETFVVEGLESLSGKNLLEIFYLIRLTGREQFWTITFDSFLKSPIFGNGSGFSDFLIKSETMGQIEQVHNDYLKVLADVGIIGLILYLAIYLIMFFNAWKNYNKDKRKKYYFFIFVATLVQILIFSLTDNVIAYAPYLLVYVFAFYTLLTYPKSEVKDENSIYN